MDNLCPKCKTLLRVSGSKYVMRDGKLYMVQDLVCRNPQCLNNGVVVKKVEHEIEISNE
jgi:hypothetical protein